MTMATRIVITARAPRPRANEGLSETQQTLRHTGTIEDGPGENEHGYGQQGILGDARIDVGWNSHDAELGQGNGQGPSQTERDRNGGADNQEQEKAPEENAGHEHQLLPFRMRMITPMARPVMTTDRIGSQTV